MHHHRRKSGSTSTTDVREQTKHSSKSSRPAPMTRRSTPQTPHKLGKSSRDRERQWDEERWYEDDRESFPQYCMACEKQFVPQYENIIYCSEECRLYDQESSSSNTTPMYSSRQSYSSSHTVSAQYSFYGTSQTEPRDIIPRASPSRPQSHFSPPTPPSSHDQTSDAIKALRSLSIRPPSPPTPSSTYHSSIWPFSKSTTASPASSYTRPLSGLFSTTYDGGYYSAAGYGVTSPSTDRPLPSRRPGSHSRPKSIELVMPMIGGQ